MNIYPFAHISPHPVTYFNLSRCLVCVAGALFYQSNPKQIKTLIFKITPDARIWLRMSPWATHPSLTVIKKAIKTQIKKTDLSLFPSSSPQAFASTFCAHLHALCARLLPQLCVHMREFALDAGACDSSACNVNARNRIASHASWALSRTLFASLSHPLCAYMRTFPFDTSAWDVHIAQAKTQHSLGVPIVRRLNWLNHMDSYNV